MNGRLTREEKKVVDSIRNRVRREAEDGKTLCPCCQGIVRVYPRKLHADMARFLIALKLACDVENRFYHPRDIMDSGEKASTDASYLDLWGLVEKNAKTYRITEMGVGFVMDRFSVPRTAYVLSPPKRVLRWSPDQTTIEQALGDKFNYDELMGG